MKTTTTRRKARPSRTSRRPAAVTALAAVLDGMGEAAVITRDQWVDGGAEVVHANRAFAALTGYPAARLPGRNTRLLHGPRTELERRTAPRWAEDGEGWLHRKDGSAFYASWRFSPVPGGGYRIGLYRDLSELHQLHEALLHSQKLDAMGQLAAGVAHDLNNLLSIINGYCEIVLPKLAAQGVEQPDLQEIHQAGLKAAAITRQILELSRRRETESRVVNANPLIREISGLLGRVMGENCQLELRLASDLGNLRIDPTQFQQILLNLAFNARDAMPDGGRFTVRTSRVDGTADGPLAATGGWVVVQVADTGVGMTAAVRRRIFEPFFTTKERGTGFGLTTVLGIVKRAGGEITVESAAGAGTRFEIRFPETAEPAQAATAAEPAAPEPPSEAVWLVEPDVLLRRMMSGMLAVEGHKLREFAAVSDLQAEPPAGCPSLLVLDGTAAQAAELYALLRPRNRSLRVLLIGNEAGPAAGRDLPAEAVTRLRKPFDLRMLQQEVDRLLGPGR